MSAPTPAPATNAPASTGFLSGLFGAKKANAPKPANAAAPAVGGGRSRKNRKNRSCSRKNRSRMNRKNSRKNRNRE